MPVVRPEVVESTFKRYVQPTRAGIDRAKGLIITWIEQTPIETSLLIRRYAITFGGAPVPVIYCHTDYKIEEQCAKAGAFWTEAINAARALSELEAFVEFSTSTHTGVSQGFTSAVDGNGGTTGAWSIAEFTTQLPGRVHRTPLSPIYSPAAPNLTKSTDPVIGEDSSHDWTTGMPPGMPPLVRSAVARAEAVAEPRRIGAMLDEARPLVGFERELMSAVRRRLDEAIDVLEMHGIPSSGELTAEQADRMVGVLQRVGGYIMAARRVLSEFNDWRDVVIMLQAVLKVMGIEVDFDG